VEDGHDATHLERILISHQVNNLECLLDNSHGEQLAAVVASLSHKGVGQSLNNWAQRLPKSLDLVSAGSVWQVCLVLGLDGNEIFQANVAEGQAVIRPLPKQLDFRSIGSHDGRRHKSRRVTKICKDKREWK
jgi:hypothetical protein